MQQLDDKNGNGGSKSKTGCLIAILLLVLLVLLATIPMAVSSKHLPPGTNTLESINKASTQTSPSVDRGSVDSAWYMSMQFVKRQLRSPRTADFSGQYASQCVRDVGNNIFEVSGYVDSQNGFGALIRTNFTITVKYLGDDQWQRVRGPIFEQ